MKHDIFVSFLGLRQKTRQKSAELHQEHPKKLAPKFEKTGKTKERTSKSKKRASKKRRNFLFLVARTAISLATALWPKAAFR
jgi:hypothetical protein